MKIKYTTLLAVLLTLALMQTASAVSIGAGPSTIDYGKLVKGGYAEQTVTVSTSGDEDLTCSIEFTGDIKNWMSADKGKTFLLPANSRQDLKIIIQPPTDAANGRYEGSLYIKAAPTSTITSGAGLIVGAGIKIKIAAEVTGEEIVSYKLKQTSISNTEIGYPLRISALIENTGNVKVKPDIIIEITDMSNNLKKTYNPIPSEILPTVETNLQFELPSTGLDVGAYNAKITVGNEEQTLTFNILEKGTLALKGILKEVSLNKIWAETGETVKITGKIENTGEILIEGAKLNAEIYMIDDIYQTEKLVKVVTSDDALNIPVGETTELNTYFTPSKAGRYMVYGTVAYSGKKTQPKSTILNVVERPKDYTLYVLITIIILIAALYWLTKKSDDGRTRRFRKIWGDYLQLK